LRRRPDLVILGGLGCLFLEIENHCPDLLGIERKRAKYTLEERELKKSKEKWDEIWSLIRQQNII
jgi:hypothetical protein